MTGLAAIVGVLGIGFGYWWTDAAAAGFIAFGIIKDGVTQLRSSTAELVDGTPRELEKDEIAPEAKALRKALEERFPGGVVRLRETGRYIHAEVCGVAPKGPQDLKAIWPGAKKRAWRLAQLSFVPPVKD
jgi:divalent metal cation (Fe/Co/Zn/Cd) transporter